MFNKHLDDYYKLKISLKEITEQASVSESTFYRNLEKQGLLPRRAYYGLINTGISELDKTLKDKYAGIVKRCNGRPSYRGKSYIDVEYLPVYEWVKVCQDNKGLLLKMWDEYMQSGKDYRLSISVDRIDNSKGYIADNIQFVTLGFNAWKRNIRPIKATTDGKEMYFMSCEEGSEYYGIRRQSIGDILRGRKLYGDKYAVEDSTVEEVLTKNKMSNIEEYYEVIFAELKER